MGAMRLGRPHVTGAMANLLSAYPWMNQQDLIFAVKHSAIDIAPAGPDIWHGYGRLRGSSTVSLIGPYSVGRLLHVTPVSVHAVGLANTLALQRRKYARHTRGPAGV